MIRADRLLAAVLARAAVLLPRAHRERWREEALAVLLDVSGTRRWRYLLDTLVKLPLLAWQHRTARPAPVPGRPRAAVSALAGAGLLSTAVALLGAFLLAPVTGEDAAEFLLVVSFFGMAPLVTARAVRQARLAGGGAVRLAGAAVVGVLAGTGPVGGAALTAALDRVAPPSLVLPVALSTAALPGLWLVLASWQGWRAGAGPRAHTVLGVLAGFGLLVVLVNLQVVSRVDGSVPAPFAAVAVLALLLLMPTYLAWSVWAGIRLLAGRTELLTT